MFNMHKKLMLDLYNTHKTLGKTLLDSSGEKGYNPPRTQGKEATENMYNTSFNVFEPERSNEFPNLLADKDFAYYYWTLPVCTL